MVPSGSFTERRRVSVSAVAVAGADEFDSIAIIVLKPNVAQNLSNSRRSSNRLLISVHHLMRPLVPHCPRVIVIHQLRHADVVLSSQYTMSDGIARRHADRVDRVEHRHQHAPRTFLTRNQLFASPNRQTDVLEAGFVPRAAAVIQPVRGAATPSPRLAL